MPGAPNEHTCAYSSPRKHGTRWSVVQMMRDSSQGDADAALCRDRRRSGVGKKGLVYPSCPPPSVSLSLCLSLSRVCCSVWTRRFRDLLQGWTCGHTSHPRRSNKLESRGPTNALALAVRVLRYWWYATPSHGIHGATCLLPCCTGPRCPARCSTRRACQRTRRSSSVLVKHAGSRGHVRRGMSMGGLPSDFTAALNMVEVCPWVACLLTSWLH